MSVKKYFRRFLLGFILFLYVSPAYAGEVKFVQLTDVHYTDKNSSYAGRMLEQSGELLKDAVKKVNTITNLDFVVLTGDLINTPDKELVKNFGEMANKLDTEWYWTIGNHDVGLLFGKDDFVSAMNEVATHKVEKSYYSFVKDDFVFICMGGAIDRLPTAHAEFLPEELEWLDAQLEKYKDKYAVIFQHFPLLEPFQSKTHYIINAKQYYEVIDRHDNVIAVVTGHYHAAEINRRNNVLHVSSPALVQYPNAFRLITISTVDEGVRFDFEFITSGLEDVRKQSEELTRSSRMNEGSSADRDTTIILKREAPVSF